MTKQSAMFSSYYLVSKYGGSVPRYTSYPPVPSWTGAPNDVTWYNAIRSTFEAQPDAGVSLYIHLPFCQQLCTYCACNKRITVNHAVEDPYIQSVLKEWRRYKAVLPRPFRLNELHLGGGTPTFFSPENLSKLLVTLLEDAVPAPGAAWSVEVHPNYTSREHLEVLYNSGFRRVSIGVQSMNAQVQHAINRIQPIANVERVTRWARDIGYTSVNFDIIYGLPFQSQLISDQDVSVVIQLRPDRIAHYGYAHVPWKHAGQRRYTDADLPDSRERFQSAESARQLFKKAGYIEIGMDHYALPTDSLSQAQESKKLHRNFMGYTDQPTDILIGLGMSSISETRFGYVQNEKVLELYHEKVHAGTTLFSEGHRFSTEDLRMKARINELMCSLKTDLDEDIDDYMMHQLNGLQEDGIIQIDGNCLTVKAHSRMFLRSVCAVFDPAFRMDKPSTRFSQNL